MVSPQPTILLDQVCFGYRQPLFANLSLGLNPGDLVHLNGANGSGKSSLLRLVAGLESPSKGFISRFKKDQESPHTWLLACDADGLMASWTAKQNLEFFASFSRTWSSKELAEMYGIWSIGNRRFYQDLPTRFYSSGMRRKLALAIAFAIKPQLLLLDEPVRSLDQNAVKIFSTKLADYLKEGGSVMLAHHSDKGLTELTERPYLELSLPTLSLKRKE